MDIKDIKNINQLTSYCGGIIPFDKFLMSVTRPIAENYCGVLAHWLVGSECEDKSLRVPLLLKNVFIIRYPLCDLLGEPDNKYLRVYWSADNHPDCEKIYFHHYKYELSDLLSDYRNYKLNIILV